MLFPDWETVIEDWVFHAALPLAAYAALVACAGALPSHATASLFAAAAASVLLVAIGVHNAWDTVTCIVASRRARRGGRHD